MHLLLAVSGGADSMYLAYNAEEFFPHCSFGVAHCNFHLRGEDSDADQAFVQKWCQERGLEFHLGSFPTLEYAKEKGISIEMAARELRYSFFSRICTEYGYDGVVTAHNASDNAETMILNLVRGCGTKGLRGMSQDRTIQQPPLRMLRPMLEITRPQIEAWLTEHSYQWREDCTNAQTIYKRNLIRHKILPALEELNPSAMKTLREDMRRIAQVDDIAQDYFQQKIAQKDALPKKGLEGELCSVDWLVEQKHWRYLLHAMTEGCGFSAPTMEKLHALLEKYKTQKKGTVTLGSKVFQSGTHTLSILKGCLCLTSSEPDKE